MKGGALGTPSDEGGCGGGLATPSDEGGGASATVEYITLDILPLPSGSADWHLHSLLAQLTACLESRPAERPPELISE